MNGATGPQGPQGVRGETGDKGDRGEPGYANIANNLTTTAEGYALDARQGKFLSGTLETLNQNIEFSETVYSGGLCRY